MKKQRKIAVETEIRNVWDGDPMNDLEAYFGEDNRVVTLIDGAGLTMHPKWNAPFHENENMIESKKEDRIERLARRLMGLS